MVVVGGGGGGGEGESSFLQRAALHPGLRLASKKLVERSECLPEGTDRR